MSPTVTLVLRCLHILAVIFWVGGLTTSIMLMRNAQEPQGATAPAVHRLFQRLINPAMIVAWLAALAMLIDGWSALYARAGWMHGKLTLVVILSALTGVASGRVRRIATGDKSDLGPLRLASWAVPLVAILVVVLVTFRFGAP